MRVIEDYNCNNPGKVWRQYRYDMDHPLDRAKYIARTRYAFPGGYELFAVTDDGAVLCFDCCRTEYRQIVVSDGRDGWNVDAVDCAANLEEPEQCAHCGRSIS